VYSNDDFFPFTSRQTIAQMVQALEVPKERGSHLAALICVNGYAGYFLQEIVLLGADSYTGLEGQLRDKAHACFSSARTAASHLLKEHDPTLPNLQALIYGVIILFLATAIQLSSRTNIRIVYAGSGSWGFWYGLAFDWGCLQHVSCSGTSQK
jgi:hypothetical protein